jgi:hypothetical protein
MYLMFVAASHDGKINLVEWRSAKRDVEDLEEEFETAIDEWSIERPHMGDWTMVHALTVNGGKIVQAQESGVTAAPGIDRGARIMAAIKANITKEK